MTRTRNKKKKAEYEAELYIPPLPLEALDIWNTYWRLRKRKASGGFGVSPLEWPDIAAFSTFAGIRLSSWELEIIEMIDDLFVSIHSKREG